MRRPLKALLLIAVMLWQTLAWVTPFGVQAQGEQMAHMTVHQQDRDHHHHDDESLHLSSDSDSAEHLHADDGFQPAGLSAVWADTGFPPLPGMPPVADVKSPATVFLEGLLRPPST